MLFLVLLISIGSNVAQFIYAGPRFGGMSGVVYGLFGYVWIKGNYDRNFGIRLTDEAVSSMLLWLVLCMTGLLGPIANAAHVAGLLIGMAVAVLSVPGKNKMLPETRSQS